MSNKRVSPLWLHFEDDGKRASCLYCNSKLVHHSSTTPLKNHLSAKHPEHLPPIFQTQVSRFQRAKVFRNALDRDLIRALIRDLRPLSEMEGALADTVCRLLSSWDRGPKRDVFRQNLEVTQNEYQKKLDLLINIECSSLALAIEIWSLTRNDKFLYASIYGHFMTRSFQIVSVVLGVEYLCDLHPATLVRAINRVLIYYSLSTVHISCIIAPVTENSVDVCQACSMMNVPFEECLTSLLKQVVQEILQPHTKLLDKVRSLIASIKCHYTLNQRFLAFQTLQGDREYPLPLLHDHPNRLLSSHDMLSRLTLLQSILNQFIISLGPDNQFNLNSLTEEEWKTCSCIAQYLLTFRELSEELNSERYLSGSSATVSLLGWIRYQQEPNDDLIIDQLRCATILAFSRRSKTTLPPFIFATALDPRWKHLPSWPIDYINFIQLELRKQLEALSVPDSSENELPSKRRKRFVYVVEPQSSPLSCDFDELDSYQNEPRQDLDSNPIDWWIQHSPKYPKLSLLARRYLAIPPSATSSITLATRRAALGPTNVRTMVMLNRNMDVLDALYSTSQTNPDPM